MGLITEYESDYAGIGTVYVRRFEVMPSEDRTRARLSGPEIEVIRAASPNVPALVLLYWETPDEPELWYPTLVFPAEHPTYIFGPS